MGLVCDLFDSFAIFPALRLVRLDDDVIAVLCAIKLLDQDVRLGICGIPTVKKCVIYGSFRVEKTLLSSRAENRGELGRDVDCREHSRYLASLVKFTELGGNPQSSIIIGK